MKSKNMLTKRIIPCLDVKDGRTVKGTNFVNLRDAGDPVELAARYSAEGADELVFLDISATNEGRKTFTQTVRQIAREINIPFTVGGGISSVADIGRLLDAGADKISINTAAVQNPRLIAEAARKFGAQCIVLAIDARRTPDGFRIYLNGGRVRTDIGPVEWAIRGVREGAGEILLTSMDADGTRRGFDIELTRAVASSVTVPVIASGGGGKLDDFASVFASGGADAALAAGIFHFRELEIATVKRFLKMRGFCIRI